MVEIEYYKKAMFKKQKGKESIIEFLKRVVKERGESIIAFNDIIKLMQENEPMFEKANYEENLYNISSILFEEGILLDRLSVRAYTHDILLVLKSRSPAAKKPTKKELEYMWMRIFRL